MPSEANLLCCSGFDKKVQEKHMGGTHATTDLGRPLISSNGTPLPGRGGAKSWGDPDWHDYARQPNGLFDGDAIHSEGFFVGNHEAIIEEGSRTYLDGTQESFWEAMDVVEPWDGPFDALYDPEDEDDSLADAFILRKGDLIKIQVEKVFSGGVRFFSESVEEDELVGGQRSVRVPLLRRKTWLPFLEGETVTVKVVGISTKPPKKKSQTTDGRKYVFLLVEVVAWR